MPGSKSAQDSIAQTLDSLTSDSSKGVPGIVFRAVGKDGGVIASHASGCRGLNHKELPMTEDTVFYIASCTKMVTGIACMQLVEQGKLHLDAPAWDVLPGLKNIKVLGENGELVERKGDITLRNLLTHTAGFGYTFFNERLRDYSRPQGFDEFSGDIADYIDQPLVNQPGERWEYGINIDWAGLMVEKISGLKLGDYFQKYIFEPLDVQSTSMLPSDEMKSNMSFMHQRDANMKARERDHVARRALSVDENVKRTLFHAGGAGLFSKPKEYCKILATLLNDGTSPITNKQILKPETVKEMFTNQIPQFPNFGRQEILPAKPELTNGPLYELYPQAENPPQGWGLTFMITQQAGETGRGQNTGWWAGISNLFWWCDREKGVAGMIAGAVLPFGDPEVMGHWGMCEAAVYQGL